MWDLSFLIPGDNGIASTANAVRRCVFYGVRLYPIVRLTAERLVAHLPERDEVSEVGAVRDWVMKHYRYTSDPVGLEYVKAPWVSLGEIKKFDVMVGDCDDVTCLVSALLTALGYRVNLVVIASENPAKGSDYKHIYLRVYLSKAKRWLAVECTARGRDLGWEAPSGREREFPLY